MSEAGVRHLTECVGFGCPAAVLLVVHLNHHNDSSVRQALERATQRHAMHTLGRPHLNMLWYTSSLIDEISHIMCCRQKPERHQKRTIWAAQHVSTWDARLFPSLRLHLARCAIIEKPPNVSFKPSQAYLSQQECMGARLPVALPLL